MGKRVGNDEGGPWGPPGCVPAHRAALCVMRARCPPQPTELAAAFECRAEPMAVGLAVGLDLKTTYHLTGFWQDGEDGVKIKAHSANVAGAMPALPDLRSARLLVQVRELLLVYDTAAVGVDQGEPLLR